MKRERPLFSTYLVGCQCDMCVALRGTESQDELDAIVSVSWTDDEIKNLEKWATLMD